jgi:phosphinothricin acetyltransferase
VSPITPGKSLELRLVTPADLASVAAIYDHYVEHSVCTFATEPTSIAYWHDWLDEHTGAHPAIVAAREGTIVGWGSLSTWNSRCAYRHTVEDSVYVHAGCHGQGIGRAILSRLVELARDLRHRSVIAQIADHQPASEGLHASLGFQEAGCLRNVGFKFDRWVDVVLWQLEL